MENDKKESAAGTPPPSPSPPAKVHAKGTPAPAYTATEDTFKDTATLVKEDSDM